MPVFGSIFSKQCGLPNWVTLLKAKFPFNSISGVQMPTILYAYYVLRSLWLPSELKLVEEFTETPAAVQFRIFL
jgi:hypothetical protein